MNYENIKNGTWVIGECIEIMQQIPAACVDMILCDLPYGTTQNKWDSIIPFEPLWREYWRICKGAIVLTSAQPFTSALVMSQVDKFKFGYVWDTYNKYSNYLNAKRQPMRRHEDISVFAKKNYIYNPQMEQREEVFKSRRTKTKGSENYSENNGEDYGRETKEKTPCSVLVIPGRQTNGTLHPTQKPVELFDLLIRTYSNEGDLVLDNTAGSGTTAIAAENTKRRWVCIEQDEDYSAKAKERIKAL